MNWDQKMLTLLSSSFPFSVGLLFSHMENHLENMTMMILSINFIGIIGIVLMVIFSNEP